MVSWRGEEHELWHRAVNRFGVWGGVKRSLRQERRRPTHILGRETTQADGALQAQGPGLAPQTIQYGRKGSMREVFKKSAILHFDQLTLVALWTDG